LAETLKQRDHSGDKVRKTLKFISREMRCEVWSEFSWLETGPSGVLFENFDHHLDLL
jgi:hypothetical protein